MNMPELDLLHSSGALSATRRPCRRHAGAAATLLLVILCAAAAVAIGWSVERLTDFLVMVLR